MSVAPPLLGNDHPAALLRKFVARLGAFEPGLVDIVKGMVFLGVYSLPVVRCEGGCNAVFHECDFSFSLRTRTWQLREEYILWYGDNDMPRGWVVEEVSISVCQKPACRETVYGEMQEFMQTRAQAPCYGCRGADGWDNYCSC